MQFKNPYFMNREFANIAIVIVLVVVIAGTSWWYLNKSSAPTASETTEFSTTQQTTQQSMNPVTPLPTKNQPTQNTVSSPQKRGDIIIDEKDKNCSFDLDCAAISTACGDCGLDVVNKSYIQKYESKLKQVCENKYPKIACDLDYRGVSEIRCVDLKCKFVPKQ